MLAPCSSSGVEPSLKWRTYAESIVDLGKQCGVTKVVHIGALLDAVPHTREILLTGSSNNKDMLETLEDHGIGPLVIRTHRHHLGLDGAAPSATSPSHTLGSRPHYLHAAPNYTVSHALVKALSDLLMASMDLGELSEASVTYHEQVSSAVIEDSQLSSYIESWRIDTTQRRCGTWRCHSPKRFYGTWRTS